MAFLLSAMPVSAKVALGSSGFSIKGVLEKVDSNALTLLEKSLSYRLAVLENSDVPEDIPNFQNIYSKAPEAKIEIDSIADDIVKNVGGQVAKAPIKSQDRAIQKILNDYSGDASKIKDLARNTIIVDAKNIDNVVSELSNKGASVKVINGNTDPLGYSGINTSIKTKSGITAEIQVNTPEMIYAKEPENIARSLLGDDTYKAISDKTGIKGGQGHKFYEDWRVLDSETSAAKSIAEQSRDYYDSIRKANAD